VPCTGADQRAQRSVIARERQIPMLLTTRKANIEHPPRAFVDIAIRNVAGSINFLKTGASAAFAAVEDQELKREFTASNDSAIAAFEKAHPEFGHADESPTSSAMALGDASETRPAADEESAQPQQALAS